MVWLDNLPITALDGEIVRDIQADHLGTPRVVIDRATDKAIWTWPLTGAAYGSRAPNEDVDEDRTKNVFDMRFPGQRYDAVTGLFQNGWRDYDPMSGRYIQSDPIGLAGGISTYAYAGNNPYVRIDPRGLDFAIVGDDNTVQVGASSFEFGFAGHAAFRSVTTRVQDIHTERWADKHLSDPYSGVSNNCADLVYGGLDAAGIPARRPWLLPSVPNAISSNLDRSGLSTHALSTPNWSPGIYNHQYKRWP